jgi:hypothetical protein
MTVLQKIDQKIETEIKKLEMQGKLPRLEDMLPEADETVIQYVNYALNVLFVVLPFVILLGAYLFNSSIKNQIDARDGIISGIKDWENYKQKLAQLETTVISRVSIANKGAAAKQVNQVLSRGTKTRGEVNIGDFEQYEKGESILVTEGSIEFKDFSQDEFSNLVNKLIVGLTMNITEVEIFKDDKTKFLKGMFRFTHYGKK